MQLKPTNTVSVPGAARASTSGVNSRPIVNAAYITEQVVRWNAELPERKPGKASNAVNVQRAAFMEELEN